MRPKFCIVTPTIPGRSILLKAAMASVKAQTLKDHWHVVCSDGDAPEAREACLAEGVTFDSIPKAGNWGYAVRNHVVQNYDAEYFMFLDDDNVYNPNCLEEVAKRSGHPFISFQIDYIGRWLTPTQRWAIPFGPTVEMGNFDQMNMCIRSDIAKQVSFKPTYEQDFQYAKECLELAGRVEFIPQVLGIYSWNWGTQPEGA